MRAKALQILRAEQARQQVVVEMPDQWTYKRVKEALVDAYRMLRSSSGRVGPNSGAGYWPEMELEEGDYAPEIRRRPQYVTPMNVDRMEIVVCGWRDEDGGRHPAWLAGLTSTPDIKRKLEGWMFAQLNGVSDQDLCERRKWAQATFKRHRDKAATIIALRLNAAGLPVW